VGKVGKAPAVLIVEDEALIRLGAVRMIEDAGFEVIEAANADEAIQIKLHALTELAQQRSCQFGYSDTGYCHRAV
jgi:CheY-like chemotaxis protein